MIGCLPTQALAFLAVFVYATHATQAFAFEWKPGFRRCYGSTSLSCIQMPAFMHKKTTKQLAILSYLPYSSRVYPQFTSVLSTEAAKNTQLIQKRLRSLPSELCTVHLWLGFPVTDERYKEIIRQTPNAWADRSKIKYIGPDYTNILFGPITA